MKIKEQQDPQKTPAKESVQIDVKRRECTLSEQMQKLMLRQMQHELYNHNVYLTFANYFGIRGLSLLEEYYKLRAHEEYIHFQWVMNWMNQNDAEFICPAVEQYSDKISDYYTPFNVTVDLEIQTSALIDEMIDLAFDEGDYATYNWLFGHDPEKGRLREEQVEEEATSRTVRDIANTEGSWLRKEKSILDFYKKNA